jgi:hypothetical protein
MNLRWPPQTRLWTIERFPTGAVRLCVAAVVALASGCAKPQPTKSAKPNAPSPEALASLLEGGELVFQDDFERESLGKNWACEPDLWRIEEGVLFGKGARNSGCWLTRELPDKVRVELTARSESPDGDLKFEIFATKPEHGAGYICVFGGWKNTTSIIARLDEHGEDRLVAPKKRVDKSKSYRMSAVRTDGTLHWFIDGKHFASYEDAEPIRGRHFGLNDWDAPVYFDDIAVYALD